MKIPFLNSEDLKNAMSGVDLALDLENIKSSLDRVPNDLIEIIGLPVYNAMIAHFELMKNPPEPPAEGEPEPEPEEDNSEIWDELVKLCQKAMFPLALYKHFIWLQIRVSNSGITTTKNNNETTAYKYQTDEAKDSLLDSWGDFISQIIDHLNANEDVITEWHETDQYAAQTSALFKNYRDFSRVANIRPADAAFYIRISDLLTDITTDEVNPTLDLTELDPTAPKFRKAQKFAAFRALSLAAIQFDISVMPAPMRRVMLNEMNGKNGNEFDYVKGKLSGHYKQEAETWMQKLTNDILADEKAAETDTPREITKTVYNSTDKAVGIC